jgi:hypothetical protein
MRKTDVMKAPGWKIEHRIKQITGQKVPEKTPLAAEACDVSPKISCEVGPVRRKLIKISLNLCPVFGASFSATQTILARSTLECGMYQVRSWSNEVMPIGRQCPDSFLGLLNRLVFLPMN